MGTEVSHSQLKVRGHIVFGADPVGNEVGFCLFVSFDSLPPS